MRRKLLAVIMLLVSLCLMVGTTVAFAVDENQSQAPDIEIVKGIEYTFTKDGQAYAVTLLSDTEYSLTTKNTDGNTLVHIGDYMYVNERLTLKKNGEIVGIYLVHEKSLIDVTAFEIAVDNLPEDVKSDVKKGVDEFYEWIKPYLGYALTFGIGGLIVGFIVFFIIKYLIKKFEKNYETKKMAKAFAEEVGKQDISLDISAVVETRLDNIRKDLKADIQPVVENFAIVQNAVAFLCAAMSNSKVVPAEIRDQLSTQAKQLNSSAVSKEKEIVKLQLAKAPVTEVVGKKNTGDNNGLFGGYNET